MSDKSVCRGCARFTEPGPDGYDCPVADAYNTLIDEHLKPLGVVTQLTVTECPQRLQLDEALMADGDGGLTPSVPLSVPEEGEERQNGDDRA